MVVEVIMTVLASLKKTLAKIIEAFHSDDLLLFFIVVYLIVVYLMG